MNNVPTRKTPTKFATTVAATLLLAVATVAASQTIKSMVLRHEVDKMSDEIGRLKIKTVCVGRLLIDVPFDADVAYRTASVGGWTITPGPRETDEEFFARVAAREIQLESMKNKREQPSLERARQVNAGQVTGKIFVFGREWTHGFERGKRTDETAVAMESHVRTGGTSFTFAAPLLDEEDEKELAQIVSQVRPRAIDEVPSEAAFCFNSGMVLDPLNAKQSENVSLFVGLKGKPDVSIALSTYAGRTPPTTLLERNKIAEEEMDAGDRSRFTYFSQGERAINGIAGEEVLEKVTEYNGTTGHSFMWETNHNDKANVLSPFVVFEMSTGHGQAGNPAKSSLSDAEALALWGKISSSIRLREHGPEALPSQTQAGTPRGTLKMSGAQCPASGWWQCSDGIGRVDVSGGRVQYLPAGQMVPQGGLLPPATAWQKLGGAQPTPSPGGLCTEDPGLLEET